MPTQLQHAPAVTLPMAQPGWGAQKAYRDPFYRVLYEPHTCRPVSRRGLHPYSDSPLPPATTTDGGPAATPPTHPSLRRRVGGCGALALPTSSERSEGCGAVLPTSSDWSEGRGAAPRRDVRGRRVRLRRRGRGLGRLRAGEPADRGRQRHGAAAGARRRRQERPPGEPIPAHAHGALHPHEPAEVQLGLRDRAGARLQPPPDALPARPRARRLQLDKRHGVRARPRPGLRALGSRGRRGLGLPRLPALLPQDGDLGWRRVRTPRQRRAASHDERRDGEPAVPGVHRRGRGGRLPEGGGSQWRGSGRLWPDGDDGEGRREALGLVGLPLGGCAGAVQPHDPPLGPRPPRQLRRPEACDGRGVLPSWSDRERRGATRGAAVRGRDRLASSAAAVRRRAGARAGGGGPARPLGARGRGGQPAGPPGGLLPAQVHQACLAQRSARAALEACDRRPLDPHAARAGSDQSFRGGWLHPQLRRGALPRHSVPLPAGGDAV